MKCWRCGFWLPRIFQPVYKRRVPKIQKWSWKSPALRRRTRNEDNHRRSKAGMDTNQGRLLHRSKALTTEQVTLAWTLYNQKKTQSEIAEVLGVNQATISRELARFPDTREMAKARMNGALDLMVQHTLKAAANAAEKGDATAALEVLDRTDVLPAKARNAQQSGAAKVTVIVGTVPGAPLNIQALPAEIIDALPEAPRQE